MIINGCQLLRTPLKQMMWNNAAVPCCQSLFDQRMWVADGRCYWLLRFRSLSCRCDRGCPGGLIKEYNWLSFRKFRAPDTSHLFSHMHALPLGCARREQGGNTADQTEAFRSQHYLNTRIERSSPLLSWRRRHSKVVLQDLLAEPDC